MGPTGLLSYPRGTMNRPSSGRKMTRTLLAWLSLCFIVFVGAQDACPQMPCTDSIELYGMAPEPTDTTGPYKAPAQGAKRPNPSEEQAPAENRVENPPTPPAEQKAPLPQQQKEVPLVQAPADTKVEKPGDEQPQAPENQRLNVAPAPSAEPPSTGTTTKLPLPSYITSSTIPSEPSTITSAPASSGIPSSSSNRTSSTACGQCSVLAEQVSVYFWPTASVKTSCARGAKFEAPKPTNAPSANKTSPAPANDAKPNGGINVVDGYTFSFPSTYISVIGGLSVRDSCGVKGGAYTNPPPFPVQAITTASYASWPSTCRSQGGYVNVVVNTLAQEDIACPTWGVSDPFYTTCDGDVYLTATYGPPYNPVILVPQEILNIDPTWDDCKNVPSNGPFVLPCGVYDPPRALQTQDSMVAPGAGTDPAQAGPIPDSGPHPTALPEKQKPEENKGTVPPAIQDPSSGDSGQNADLGVAPPVQDGQKPEDAPQAGKPPANAPAGPPANPPQQQEPQQAQVAQPVIKKPPQNAAGGGDPGKHVYVAPAMVPIAQTTIALGDTPGAPAQQASKPGQADLNGSSGPQQGGKAPNNAAGGNLAASGSQAQGNQAPGNAAPGPAPAAALFSPHTVNLNGQTVQVVGPSAVAFAGTTLTPGSPVYSSNNNFISLASNGQLVGGTLTPAPYALTFDGSTIPANSASAVVISDQTLTPGGSITVHGTPIGIPTAGNVAVVGGKSQPLVTPLPGPKSAPEVLTVAGKEYTADSASAFIVSGQTLTPGGSINVQGTPISLAPDGSQAIIASSTQNLAPTLTQAPTLSVADIMTFNGKEYTADSTSAFTIDGQVLRPGAKITVSGTPISLPTGGNEAIIGSSTQTLSSTTLTAGGQVGTVLTVDGLIMTVQPNGAVVNGTSIAAGGAAVTLGDGEVVSLSPGGVVSVDGSAKATLTGAGVPADTGKSGSGGDAVDFFTGGSVPARGEYRWDFVMIVCVLTLMCNYYLGS